MEAEILAGITPTVLGELAQRYGAQELKKMGGFENAIYSYESGGSQYVLRVVHSSHRTPEKIASELHWLGYLAQRGLRVCQAFPSIHGREIEVIQTEVGEFYATSFERSPGIHPGAHRPETWTPTLFRKWGEFTARMHTLTLEYHPPSSLTPRPEDEGMARSFIEGIQGPYKEIAGEVMEHHQAAVAAIRNLARHSRNYGLCHTDLHQGNFHWHQGEIIAFDFDDCAYDYFLGDVAIGLIYSAYFPQWSTPCWDPKELRDHARIFLGSFLDGYRSIYPLDPDWAMNLQLFLRRRQTCLLLLFVELWGEERLDPKMATWCEKLLENIRSGAPVIPLDGLCS